MRKDEKDAAVALTLHIAAPCEMHLLTPIQRFATGLQCGGMFPCIVVALVQSPDARPITVLTSIYRVWARCQAAKVYAAMLPHLPPELCGSVPGKSAMDMAWDLQNEIEFSLLSGQPLVGFALDLSKAYNTISRPVLEMAAGQLGWPDSLRAAYCQFLKGVRRHFRIGHHMSAPLLSHTGVPEGCPLAVVSMIAITWLVSTEVQLKHEIPMKSYVDNWAVQSESAVVASAAVQTIAETTAQLAMTVSLTKSCAYSTCKQSRGFLRRLKVQGATIPVVSDFTDLGVVFCARANGCAKGFQHRLEKNTGKFLKLQLVNWSLGKKVASLCRVILPATLHGCELASLSASSLRSLRGKCNKAIWGEHSQRNHYLAPLIGGSSIYEPWLLVFKQRWQTFRRIWASMPSVWTKWNQLVKLSIVKGVGPMSYFLLDLQFLGWEPRENGWIHLPCGSILHIYFSNWDVVWGKLLAAWEGYVTAQVQSYKDLQGLQGFSVVLVRARLATKQGYNSQVANYACGAIVPAQRRKHFTCEQDTKCPFCESYLTTEHMLLHCPSTAVCRENFTELLQQCTSFEVQWGLFACPVEIQELHSALRLLQWEHVPCRFLEADVQLFTDGSTIWPTVPCLSLSTWAVVLAEPGKLEGTRVVNGVVPGDSQTNNRAELLAVLAAVLSGTGGCIYSDSDVTVSGFRRLQKDGWSPLLWRKHANLDVWYSLYQALQRSPRPWRVVKVSSHQDWHAAPDAYHAWVWYHNDAADSFAKEAHQNFGQAVLSAHKRAQSALQAMQNKQHAVYQLQLGVSQCFHQVTIGKSKANSVRLPDDLLQCKIQALQMLMWDAGVLFPGRTREPEWPRFLLCAPFGHHLFNWLRSQEWVWDPGGFSLLEMYYVFTGHTGWLVPLNVASWLDCVRPVPCRGVKVKALWVHETQYPELMLHRQTLTCQLVTFAHAVRSVMQHSHCPWKVQNMPALKFLGVPCKVPALQFRPKLPEATKLVQRLQKDMCGRSYRLFLKTCYVAPRTPLESQLEYPQPQQVFAKSRRFHRLNR